MARTLRIDNTPDTDTLRRMELLAVMVFEPLREAICEPIRVNSFYRSERLNTAIKGSKNSQHVRGEAMDVSCGARNQELFEYILNNLTFDQLIWEFGTEQSPSWVHVSYNTTGNRGQVLRSKKTATGVVYEKF